jgi:glycosidase
LQNGERGAELEFINSSDAENILAFVRRNDKEKILAVFNLSDKAKSFTLNDKLIKGTYRNFFTDEETSFNEKESIILEGWGYKILIRK